MSPRPSDRPVRVDKAGKSRAQASARRAATGQGKIDKSRERSERKRAAAEERKARLAAEARGESPSRPKAPSERRRSASGTDDEKRDRRRATSDAARSQLRPGPGQELIYGRRPVLEALRAGRGIDRVLVAAGAGERGALGELTSLAKTRRVPVRTVPRGVLDDELDAAVHQGVVAVVAPLTSIELDELLAIPLAGGSEPPFLLAIDSVTDPHNLGALVRSADAAGAHGVVVPRHRSAPLSATALKSSAGALEHVPVAEVVNMSRAIDKLRSSGLWCIGLDGDAEASLFDLDLADEPVCIVVGSEGAGLHRLVRESCDVVVSIPMAGKVESLNASVAGGIALFEIRRRRLEGAKPKG
jgi:23S rRNA (guanosine2251-2'-O)-methyltransferase